MYSDELKKAEDYSLLKRTICIHIVDFDLFKESKSPYSKFLILEEKRHDLLTDKFAIMFLELGKIDSKIEKNNRKKLWMQFLKAETEELDMLKETDVPEIQKAIGFLHEMSSDDEIRELARLREKAIYDEKSAMSFARREGIKEGEAKILTKLRDKGFTEEQIRNLLN